MKLFVASLAAIATVAWGVTAPVLPDYWIGTFAGSFIDATTGASTNCTHTGQVYYNAPALSMRVDSTLSAACPPYILEYALPMAINIYDGVHHERRSYFVPTSGAQFSCDAVPIIGFMQPAYLSAATFNGSQTIVTAWGDKVLANVWTSANLLSDATVVTYADASTSAIVRHTYLGIGAPSYTIDYLSLASVPANAVSNSTFSILPSVGCMPM